MSKIKIFLATRNKGKINELKKLAKKYDIRVVNHDNGPLEVDEVRETGQSFEENALLKLRAAQNFINDPLIYIVADDSGLEIPELGNEPGVHTRRWSGKKMSDREILAYCMKKMKHLTGMARRANFKTVLAVAKGDEPVRYYQGVMGGIILKSEKQSIPIMPGFPFRPVFYIPERDKMIHELNEDDAAAGYKTHREKAFEALLGELRG